MTKYRKKPVVIEAYQFTNGSRWHNDDWPSWLHEAWNKEEDIDGAFFCVNGSEAVYIQTLEGTYRVSPDDFIIQGVQGELYPCKPDIFEQTYEAV